MSLDDETPFAKLPPMTYEAVKERAQRILDLRGKPPYTGEKFEQFVGFSNDEVAIIEEIVTAWLPRLVQKEKT